MIPEKVLVVEVREDEVSGQTVPYLQE